MTTKSASRPRSLLPLAAGGPSLLALVTLAGCVEQSGGTLYVRSASAPEGWPELTPVGQVQVKQYPTAESS